MGGNFSWDKLLRRGKEEEADNTVEFQVPEEGFGPMAPLNAPPSVSPPVSQTPPPSAPPTAGEPPAPKAPLVVDWNAVQQQMAPGAPAAAPTAPTPHPVHPTEAAAPVAGDAPVTYRHAPGTESLKPVEGHDKILSGWGDEVELTPAERAALGMHSGEAAAPVGASPAPVAPQVPPVTPPMAQAPALAPTAPAPFAPAPAAPSIPDAAPVIPAPIAPVQTNVVAPSAPVPPVPAAPTSGPLLPPAPQDFTTPPAPVAEEPLQPIQIPAASEASPFSPYTAHATSMVPVPSEASEPAYVQPEPVSESGMRLLDTPAPKFDVASERRIGPREDPYQPRPVFGEGSERSGPFAPIDSALPDVKPFAPAPSSMPAESASAPMPASTAPTVVETPVAPMAIPQIPVESAAAPTLATPAPEFPVSVPQIPFAPAPTVAETPVAPIAIPRIPVESAAATTLATPAPEFPVSVPQMSAAQAPAPAAPETPAAFTPPAPVAIPQVPSTPMSAPEAQAPHVSAPQVTAPPAPPVALEPGAGSVPADSWAPITLPGGPTVSSNPFESPMSQAPEAPAPAAEKPKKGLFGKKSAPATPPADSTEPKPQKEKKGGWFGKKKPTEEAPAANVPLAEPAAGFSPFAPAPVTPAMPPVPAPAPQPPMAEAPIAPTPAPIAPAPAPAAPMPNWNATSVPTEAVAPAAPAIPAPVFPMSAAQEPVAPTPEPAMVAPEAAPQPAPAIPAFLSAPTPVAPAPVAAAPEAPAPVAPAPVAPATLAPEIPAFLSAPAPAAPVEIAASAAPQSADEARMELASLYTRPAEDFTIQVQKDRKLGDVLLDNKLITARQLERALERQQQTKEKLGAILTSMQAISERRLLQVLAAQKNVNPWHLEDDAPTEDALKLMPEEMCRLFQALPVSVRGNILLVAMRDTSDFEALEVIRQHTKAQIEPVLADEARLAATIERVFGMTEARRIAAHDQHVAEALAASLGEPKSAMTEEETRPAAGLVNSIIEDGIRMRATDIHVEPQYERVEVRYRVDGRMMKVREIPHEIMPVLVNRMRILAGVEAVNTPHPQEGRVSIQYGTQSLDLRLSVLPSNHGSRVVLHLIDKTVGLQTLDQLGFEAQNLSLFRQLIHKPYGVVLLSSPNGTGKTTTLYAALHELRNPATNILTCEDPVEYDLAGVNQTQINEKIGLNYPQQVRAILGQDPDVLLIGELKDKETAELAMRAGLSGHLVLSTLPANDAASAIPRLLDMGVDPYLLSTALVGTVSQRLLRILCEDCKVESTPGDEDRALLDHYLGAGSVGKVWEAKGCDKCFETGYRGRTAVHEVMPISEEIGKMIAERAPLESIREAARYYGYLPLAYDALRRVQQGVTSLDEAKRTLVFATAERSQAPRGLDLAS